MPYRESTIEGDIHHIFNRGVDKRKIFLNTQDYLRFILALYILNDSENKYDVWSSLKFNNHETVSILKPQVKYSTTGLPGNPVVERREKLVDILAFTAMPNHYHLILKELKDNGTREFMHKFNGGYARYFNKQNQRSGALFEGPYKSVKVKTDNQLLILFNYVHTNQVALKEKEWKTVGVQNLQEALKQQNTYSWTSYHDYIGNPKFPLITERNFYLDLIGGSVGCRSSVEDWIKFKAEMADIPEYLKKL